MTLERLDNDDYQDTALIAKEQMQQLNTLFRQISKELGGSLRHDAIHLADLGNYLTESWLSDYEDLENTLIRQNAGELPNEQ